LEDRSFKYLEPDTYKQIYAKVQRTRAQRDALVQAAIDVFQESCAKKHRSRSDGPAQALLLHLSEDGEAGLEV
jgi:(p)ppGpp synthase/HD superfamily hydrolase